MNEFVTNFSFSFQQYKESGIDEPIYAWATLLVLILTLIVAFFTFWTAWKISLKQQEKENDLNVRNSYQTVVKLFESVSDVGKNTALLEKQISKSAWIYDHDLRVATEKWKNGPINDQLWENIIQITKDRIEDSKNGEELPVSVKYYQTYLDDVVNFTNKPTLEIFKEISETYPKIIVKDKKVRGQILEVVEDNFIMYLAKSVDKV